MNRGKFKFLLTLAIALVLMLLTIGIVVKFRQQAAIKQRVSELPIFCMKSVDSTTYCTSEISKATPVLLMYFHPECDLCATEATQLYANAGKLSEVSVVMVTNASYAQALQFYNEYQLFEVPTLRILLDTEDSFHSYVGATGVPTTFVYGRQHVLKKKYSGEVKVSTLLNVIFSDEQ